MEERNGDFEPPEPCEFYRGILLNFQRELTPPPDLDR